MKKIFVWLLIGMIIGGCDKQKEINFEVVPTKTQLVLIKPTNTPTPTPDIQKLYGPCTNVKVLMYHHIKNEVDSLTVTPKFFRDQLQYLKDKKYTVIGPDDLENYFMNGEKLPAKSAMITLDDAYVDNFTEAYPILKEFGYKAIIFVPTGHVNGKEYLSWEQMQQMSDLVYFGNHTWSHHSSAGTKEVLSKEIETANEQLAEHGYNLAKVFAYPYGKSGNTAEDILKNLNYKIAFTTVHGSMMCTKKNFDLPRIRIGNAPLSSYGI